MVVTLLLAGLVAAIQASNASAATVASEAGELRFVAAAGEDNAPRIGPRIDRLEIEDVVDLRVGAGCASTSAAAAVCSADGLRLLRLDLGDGDDAYEQLVGIPSVASGGPGSDQFLMPVEDVVDRIDAGPGNDTILARDGVADQIRAGSGLDTVELDLQDPLPRDAENVARRALDDLPNAEIAASRLRWADAGEVAVPLRCPAENRDGCEGSLRLLALTESGGAGALLGSRSSWRLSAGQTRAITVRLNRRARALAGRRRLLVQAVATMPGVSGDKTTIRRIEWIRSRGRASRGNDA